MDQPRNAAVNRTSYLAYLLILYWFIKGLLWLVVIPPWQAPDEPAHFAYAYRLAFAPKLPEPFNQQDVEKRVIASMDEFNFWAYNYLPRPQPLPESFYATPLLDVRPTQASRPVVYYFLCGLILRLIPHAAVHVQALALRCFSLLLGTLCMIAVWRALRLALPESQQAALYGLAFAVFLPQVSAIFTSVNNDVLLNLVAACCIAILYRWLRQGRWWLHMPLFLLLLSLGILVKRAALLLFVPLVVVLAFKARMPRRRRRLCVMVVGVEWALFLSWLLGCSLAPGAIRALVLQVFEQLSALRQPSLEAIAQTNWLAYAGALIKSYFLNLGWMLHPGPAVVYYAWLLIYGVCLTGFAYVSLSSTRQPRQPSAAGQSKVPRLTRSAAAVSWSIIAALCSAIFIAYGINRMLPQGRYLFPALMPLSLMLGVGLAAIGRSLSRTAAFLMLLALPALDLYSLFVVAVQTFYL